jgi:hypothetical protein
LTENDNGLSNEPVKLLGGSFVEMLLRVHEINEQIDAALVQSH